VLHNRTPQIDIYLLTYLLTEKSTRKAENEMLTNRRSYVLESTLATCSNRATILGCY